MNWLSNLWSSLKSAGKIPRGNRKAVSIAGGAGVIAMTVVATRMLWNAPINEHSLALLALMLLVYLAMVRSGEDE